MTDYLVTMESAWIVRDVRSVDDAIGIAIAEAGKRLNPAAKYVEVEAGMSACPYCEESPQLRPRGREHGPRGPHPR